VAASYKQSAALCRIASRDPFSYARPQLRRLLLLVFGVSFYLHFEAQSARDSLDFLPDTLGVVSLDPGAALSSSTVRFWHQHWPIARDRDRIPRHPPWSPWRA